MRCHYATGRCPMAGKLAPELAAGKMDQVADEVLQLSMLEVFRDLGPQCNTADVDLIPPAFAAAKQHVKATQLEAGILETSTLHVRCAGPPGPCRSATMRSVVC